MTNKEKFEKVFGEEPDIYHCPFVCSCSHCPYCGHFACHTEWWFAEYNQVKDK